ncbi:hypothetical protein [Neorhizobium petrolearium]|uniref:hypothetical protein n=1 Tax=Neorhizobium petrolearium TaxID=515361 RepID=UPI003F183A6F
MWFERRRWRDGVGKKLKTAVSANTANGLFCRDYRDGSGKPPVVFVVLDYGINEQGGGHPRRRKLHRGPRQTATGSAAYS